MTTLNNFKPGQSGTVKCVNAQGKLKKRLFDMGVTPGAAITLKKLAPLGDPMEIALRGYELALRKAEAAAVEME